MFYLEMQIRHANTHIAPSRWCNSELHHHGALGDLSSCWLQQEREKSLLLEPCLPPQSRMREFGVAWVTWSSSGIRLCQYHQVSAELYRHESNFSPKARNPFTVTLTGGPTVPKWTSLLMGSSLLCNQDHSMLNTSKYRNVSHSKLKSATI